MKYLSTAEFSKATGIATGTLRRWATDRKLIPAKMQGKGQPSFYSEDQLQAEVVINFKPRALTVQLGDGGLSLTDRVNRIRKLTGDTCRNMIEIGRHLIAAKAEVEHGNWSNWLKENFGWTDRTARNFMAVADRFGDMDVADFKPSTLQALLALPVGSEQGFIAEQAALGHPVETQSARELKANVRQANHKKSNSTKRKTFSDLKSENRANTPTLPCSPVLEQVADTPAPAIEQVAADIEIDRATFNTILLHAEKISNGQRDFVSILQQELNSLATNAPVVTPAGNLRDRVKDFLSQLPLIIRDDEKRYRLVKLAENSFELDLIADDFPTAADIQLPTAPMDPVANGNDNDISPDVELVNEQAILKRAVGYLTKAADNAPRLKEFFDGIIAQLDAKQAEIHAQERRQKNKPASSPCRL